MHSFTTYKPDNSKPMWSFASFVLRLAISVTGYNTVVKASTEPTYIEPLVKQLTDLRKIALSIVSPDFQMTRTTFA